MFVLGGLVRKKVHTFRNTASSQDKQQNILPSSNVNKTSEDKAKETCNYIISNNYPEIPNLQPWIED